MSSYKTLRKGSKGKNVIELQCILNKLFSPSSVLIADGDFGENTKKAIIQFQIKANLTADGIAGNSTWKSLLEASSDKMAIEIPQFLLADIAKKYIGTTEAGDNLAGTSKKMLEIFNADDLMVNGKTDGYPWCAAFVSMCVQKLCKSSLFFSALNPPREPSVNRFLNIWAKQHNCLIFKPSDILFKATKGDIVVFTFSHIGIVESNNGSIIKTIEGNTNAAGSREGVTVARKTRPESLIKAYIRLPMTTIGIDKQLNDVIQYC
jgi:hypothetical protein